MKKYFVFSLIFLIPIAALAQNAGNDVWTLWDYFYRLIKSLTEICWVLTIVTFLWGIVQFLRNADDPAAQKKAKSLMVGSVVAFTIAISFWALVTFFVDATQQTVDNPSDIGVVTSKN